MYEQALPSAARVAWLAEQQKRRRAIRLWQISLLAGLFLLWELTTATGLSDGFLISSPSRIAATLWQLCRSGEVLIHVGTSCFETAVGFLAGTLLGAAVAVAMWWSDTVARVLDPYLVVLNALSKPHWAPFLSSGWGQAWGQLSP